MAKKEEVAQDAESGEAPQALTLQDDPRLIFFDLPFASR
jgi:hypothetical protein